MESKKIKPRCELVKNEDSKELILYGLVLSNKSWWAADDEYICPQNVMSALKEADGEDIVVRLNTNGGDVFAGISIYNQLKDYKGSVTIKVDGIAASAGSVILMAADKIIMGVGSMLMIHNAWTFAGGDAKELRKVADDLDKISSSILDIYMTRFKGEEDELKVLLDVETFLTAKEALALGLADDEEEKDQTEDIKNSIIGKYMAQREESRNKEASKASFFMNKFK